MRSPEDIRFVADVMLGRLARWLRVLGYDTLYDPHVPRFLLPVEAKRENRILLTRSSRLIEEHPEVESFLVRPDRPPLQLLEVVRHFDLGTRWLFSRCTLCNQLVERVPLEAVRDQVPEAVQRMDTEFYRCPGCGKVYWEGSHIRRFQEFLARLQEFRENHSLLGG
ncbi:MAG TPA: hypothetical protein ENJ23_04185 [Bacteroidetes bacterium]|nr:hypothetical protein [Bacteroidota bacterium]